MKFVITGTQRSGTGYASRLLTAAGLECGHEAVFRPAATAVDFGDLAGDSSWLAVPWLRAIRMNAVPVFHQVRHPIEVLRSAIGIGFFGHPRKFCAEETYLRTIWYYDKFVFSFDDAMRRAMAYWIRWNTAIEPHALRRHRLDQFDRSVLGFICSTVGHDLEPTQLDEALAEVESKYKGQYNHNARDETVTWESLPDDPLTEQFVALAQRYGYNPSESC